MAIKIILTSLGGVQRIIETKLKELKPEYCISGMALGVDQWAIRACRVLSIPYVAAIPFTGQEKIWPIDSQEHYKMLLSCAKEIKIICTGGYASWKMQVRNVWMVDNSDLLIAVWDGSSGGTKNCIDYAISKGKQIVYIDPKEL